MLICPIVVGHHFWWHMLWPSLIVLMYYNCVADMKAPPSCVGRCCAKCGWWDVHCGSHVNFGYYCANTYGLQVKHPLWQTLSLNVMDHVCRCHAYVQRLSLWGSFSKSHVFFSDKQTESIQNTILSYSPRLVKTGWECHNLLNFNFVYILKVILHLSSSNNSNLCHKSVRSATWFQTSVLFPFWKRFYTCKIEKKSWPLTWGWTGGLGCMDFYKRHRFSQNPFDGFSWNIPKGFLSTSVGIFTETPLKSLRSSFCKKNLLRDFCEFPVDFCKNLCTKT